MITHLADISEFQGVVDWPTYGRNYGAVIVRAHNGHRPDKNWATNRDGARANVTVRGWYAYLAKDITAETQAAGFCNAVGQLRGGEFCVVDVEEGTNQTARAKAWMAFVDSRLGTRSWLYTGEAFAMAQLGALVTFADRNLWIANYSRTPALRHTLWQHTDAEQHAGIRAPCDCSIYNGTVSDLAALVGGAVSPEVAMARFPNAVDACWAPNGGVWVLAADGGVGAYGGAPFAGSYPGLPADQRQGDRAFLRIMASRLPGKLYDCLADDGSAYSF